MMKVKKLTGKQLKEKKESECLSLFEDACQLYSVGHYDAAIHNYTNIIRLYPFYVDHPKAWAVFFANRALAQFRQQNYKEVIQDCSKAIENDSDCISAYFYRGRARLESSQDEYEKAISDFNTLSRREDLTDSQRASVFFNRGLVKLYLKQHEGALEDFNQAIAYKPDSVKALYHRGKVFWMLGEYNHAEADYKKVLATDSNNETVLINYGYLLLEKQRYEEASNCFNKISNCETNCLALQGLLLCKKQNNIDLQTGKDLFQIQKQFDQLLKTDQEKYRMYLYGSVVYAAWGQPERAREECNKAQQCLMVCDEKNGVLLRYRDIQNIAAIYTVMTSAAKQESTPPSTPNLCGTKKRVRFAETNTLYEDEPNGKRVRMKQ